MWTVTMTSLKVIAASVIVYSDIAHAVSRPPRRATLPPWIVTLRDCSNVIPSVACGFSVP